MGTTGHKIRLELRDPPQVAFAEPLNRVRMKQDTVLLTQPADVSHGLKRADFVIGGHDRDENGVSANCFFNIDGIHPTKGVGSNYS